LQESGLVGLEARDEDGAEIGRISEVITDEESGEVTHVVIERLLERVLETGDERFEAPISAISVDADADFATFHADPSDEEPGDHVDDKEFPDGYEPPAPEEEYFEHEGQFVTEPASPEDAAQSEEDLAAREDWEDEGSTPDSGYPRNDVYIDPETGEEELDPFLEDNETLAHDVEDLINDTDLEVRSVKDGVVELTGSVATQEDLESIIEEIMGLDGVLEIDATDVDVG
jgi:sporulation protein YlmC with PRC-barrel domain